MLTQTLPRIALFLFLGSYWPIGAQMTTNSRSLEGSNSRVQPQPASPAAQPETRESGLAPQPQIAEPNQQPAASTKSPQTPKEEAWTMLEDASVQDKMSDRAIAAHVMGLIPNNPRAVKLAEEALNDKTPEVRFAGAAALGDMKSRASIRKLRAALMDKDPTVALAAAHSLDLMHDAAAYEVYYEVLNGQRKASRGLIASQKSMLSDPKRMAQLGFEEGIGFIPFAGIGWGAIKTITKDDSSPVRAAAAHVLARDPDPATTKALVDAVSDKSWLVRAAALEALARRGDPSVLDTVRLRLSDEKDVVRLTAAATVLRLTLVKEARSAAKRKKARAVPSFRWRVASIAISSRASFASASTRSRGRGLVRSLLPYDVI